MPGKKTPASVNLKRLYICLLALTMAAGLVSLGTITTSGRRAETLHQTHDPALAWIDEMVSTLVESRVSFHRSISSPDAAAPPIGGLTELAAGIRDKDPPFDEAFSLETVKAVERLAGLYRFKDNVAHREHWEDLQVAVRDFEKVSDQISHLLEVEKERILKFLDEEEMKHRRKIRLTGIVLSLSLFFTVLISAGLYINWRRFERAVLGIK